MDHGDEVDDVTEGEDSNATIHVSVRMMHLVKVDEVRFS